ncbi:MAG TPA: hypothetical protein VIL22_07595 [Paenibacillaceae bacterium]
MHRKKKVPPAVLALAALVVLAACAGAKGSQPGTANIDPASVSTTVTTQPEPARAGAPVELIAEIAGVPAGDDTVVQFEIRTEGKANLIDAEADSDGRYRAEYTFPQAGTFHVYLHVYYLDLHITKLAKIEVT